MKVFAAILVLAIAASPAAAASKHKKKMTAQEAEAAQIAQQNDNTLRLLRDGAWLVLPSWTLPIYFGTGMDQKLKAGDKKKS